MCTCYLQGSSLSSMGSPWYGPRFPAPMLQLRPYRGPLWPVLVGLYYCTLMLMHISWYASMIHTHLDVHVCVARWSFAYSIQGSPSGGSPLHGLHTVAPQMGPWPYPETAKLPETVRPYLICSLVFVLS